MTYAGIRQGGLVAIREIRERGRSLAFRTSLILTALVAAAVIIVPVIFDGDRARDIGITGTAPAGLAGAIEEHGAALGTTVVVHTYDLPADGQRAVRDGDIDVLLVDARRLEWRRQPDEQVQALVVAALQTVTIHDRAVAAGIDPDRLAALIAPVAVENVELGGVAGRSPDDETAALLMNAVLLMAVATFGGLVLTGVVEEKTSRVVEILLARIPARTLLTGKVVGIGLLGLAQLLVTAVAAAIATRTVDTFNVPAVRGAVIAWAVVWFLLGFALFAMAYGALGALASRTEDAQSAAAPATAVLLAGYGASFVAVGRPDTALAQVVSFLPPTAPFAMPSRIAMGAAAWWESPLAVLVALVTIATLVRIGGRVYTLGILHTGSALTLRDAWRHHAATRSEALLRD